jgi:hypothetical protein
MDEKLRPKKKVSILMWNKSVKVATHVTASLTSLHDQSFCTSTHKIPSPPHGTSTLEKAPVCTWNMSSSDDDALALAAFVLMCKRKPRKKKRDVWCKDWLWKGKPIPTLDLLEDFIRAYESQSGLWRIKSKDYHDKGKTDAAYDILLKNIG